MRFGFGIEHTVRDIPNGERHLGVVFCIFKLTLLEFEFGTNN